MGRHYILKSPIRVAQAARMIAKAIDMFIVLVFAVLLYPWGVMISAFYIAVADSIQGGQSVGKKFVGIAVVSLSDGSPCSAKQSFIRNLPFFIPVCFSIVPLWGWIFSAFFGLGFIALELYLLLRLQSGNRLGDVMADTTVIANNEKLIDPASRRASWFAPRDVPTTRTM